MKLGKKKTQELKEKKISTEELNDRYFINSQYEVEMSNILKLLNENIYDFKQIIDKFKSIKDKFFIHYSCLYRLLRNEELFEELTQNNRLSKDDLRYLLNKIENQIELSYLCSNTPLIKYILNEFILNKELVDRFNRMIENSDWCREYDIHTIFDRIEYEYKNNEEILKLNELNKKVCFLNDFDLNGEQRLELIEVLKNSEVAKNRLIQIIDNDLESQYDFDSLMNYLKKKEKKSVLNI